jgi:hypothetical protein
MIIIPEYYKNKDIITMCIIVGRLGVFEFIFAFTLDLSCKNKEKSHV